MSPQWKFVLGPAVAVVPFASSSSLAFAVAIANLNGAIGNAVLASGL